MNKAPANRYQSSRYKQKHDEKKKLIMWGSQGSSKYNAIIPSAIQWDILCMRSLLCFSSICSSLKQDCSLSRTSSLSRTTCCSFFSTIDFTRSSTASSYLECLSSASSSCFSCVALNASSYLFVKTSFSERLEISSDISRRTFSSWFLIWSSFAEPTRRSSSTSFFSCTLSSRIFCSLLS